MKISKYVLIDEAVRNKSLRLFQLKRMHKSKADIYVVCTSYQEGELFHIIKLKYLNKRYKDCFVVALANTEQKAKEYITQLIDEIYNMKTKTYDMLMKS